jgi:hypothetical protein
MKIGAENKKAVYVLIGLGVVAAYMVYSNLLSGPSLAPAPPPRTTDTAEAVPATPEKGSGPDISRAGGPATARPGTRAKNGEFHPVLRAKKKEDRVVNIDTMDPTIRLDLLAKVMKVPTAGGERNLFQILKAPPIKEVAAVLKGSETKIRPFIGPLPPPPPPPPAPPVAPPPPEPIPLRYYAYSAIHPDGKRTAYFLTPTADGDEPLEGTEGTTLKGRYRIVSIGLDKVLVEDTRDKRRESIKIEPEVTG